MMATAPQRSGCYFSDAVIFPLLWLMWAKTHKEKESVWTDSCSTVPQHKTHKLLKAQTQKKCKVPKTIHKVIIIFSVAAQEAWWTTGMILSWPRTAEGFLLKLAGGQQEGGSPIERSQGYISHPKRAAESNLSENSPSADTSGLPGAPLNCLCG